MSFNILRDWPLVENAKKIYVTSKVVLISALVIIASTNISMAQCSLEQIERPDGKTAYRVENLVTGPVATSNNLQLALTPSMINGSIYIAGIYRWRSERKVTSDDLRLILENGKALSMDRVSMQEAKAGGSLVSSVLYKLDKRSKKELGNSEVETINTKVSNNWIVLESNENSGELKQGITCLTKKENVENDRTEHPKEIRKYVEYIKNTLGYKGKLIDESGAVKFVSYFAGKGQSAPINKLDPESIYVGRNHLKIYCKENPDAYNFLKCVTEKRVV